ncbi:MAG: hypothetical protein D6712_08560 [Chloroflexi bacterium]|nr:MAG: hypothetical protein D6712_08560 [Chloroflexota bacterium]
MPINVAWDNAEKTVILLSAQERWNWREFADAREETKALLADIPHSVGVIVYIPASVELPKNILEGMREHARFRNPLVKIVVLTSDSSVIQTMYGVFRQMYPRITEAFVFTSTLARARQIVAEALGQPPSEE